MIPPRSEMPRENYTLPPGEAAKAVGEQMRIRDKAGRKLDIKTIWNKAFERFTGQQASPKSSDASASRMTEPRSPEQSDSSSDEAFEVDYDYMLKLPGVGGIFSKESKGHLQEGNAHTIANAAADRSKTRATAQTNVHETYSQTDEAYISKQLANTKDLLRVVHHNLPSDQHKIFQDAGLQPPVFIADRDPNPIELTANKQYEPLKQWGKTGIKIEPKVLKPLLSNYTQDCNTQLLRLNNLKLELSKSGQHGSEIQTIDNNITALTIAKEYAEKKNIK